jgi:hypothetical protein
VGGPEWVYWKTFVSANFFVKRSVFERIGGFDTRFNIDSSHDSDLFLRLKSSETRMCFIPVAHVESALRNRGLRTALTTARGSMFDVLLEQKHGTAAYAYTSRHLLSFFVLLNSILACSIAAYFAGTSHVALLFMALWFAGTVQYTSMRVRRSGVSPFGLFEVLITSAIIPTLVILWRAIGYIYFWLLAPSVQPLTLQTARSGT